MRGRKGFSLVEAMVVLVLMVLIMSSVYLMIMYFRDVSGTEQARVRQTQESRYLLSVFSSELKNAGSVMTLANTGSFLSAPPYFNGIYPLNNTNFPDGVILASGDPNAVSKLISEFDPTGGSYEMQVNNTIADPAWAPGDQGILIGTATAGFYVFAVESTTASTITMKTVPVYYSGLLNTTHYVDPASPKGNTVIYPVNAPVMRLADFSIYLVNERYDAAKGRNVRDLVRVTDCKDKGTENDIFGAASTAVKGVITDNVWDLQLVYTAYPNFPDVITNKANYFTSGGGTRDALLNAIRSKTFKEITVNVVALTDDYPGKGSVTYQLPLLADNANDEKTITGKFNYKTYSFLIEPRNYNIKL